jgi:uroporphyrinogen decarboxylase
MMTHRERTLAVLNYQPYDRLPLVHFGFWPETLEKWAAEGHLSDEEAAGWGEDMEGNPFDRSISAKLGFDFNWVTSIYPCFQRYGIGLVPPFEERVVEERPDGTRLLQNVDGVIVLDNADKRSIPAEVDHLLKDRASWEAHYLPRLQYSAAQADVPDSRTPRRLSGSSPLRLQYSPARANVRELTEIQKKPKEEGLPVGIYCGSLIGRIREWCGLVGLSYIIADDEGLLDEMIDTCANLCYVVVEQVLAMGARFDFGHFWEDMAFKNGPLINPAIFERKLGPHYARIVKLVNDHGINIVSLDCDGRIDKLIPTWLHAGVNTMFPIEVGTWGASIAPWRKQYGREIRGVGGMDKRVFAQDHAAVDAEVQRLKPLVELGGYIPCPDHNIPPDAKWENVQYYCDRMRQVFG